MESNEPKPKKRNIAPVIIVPVVLIAGFFGIKTLIHRFNYESTDNAQIETNATPIVSRLAGFIDSVAVNDYDGVKNGQLLISIDDREYSLAVLQAETDLANARAALIFVFPEESSRIRPSPRATNSCIPYIHPFGVFSLTDLRHPFPTCNPLRVCALSPTTHHPG